MTVAATAASRRARAGLADRLPAIALGLLVAPVLAVNGGYYATSWGWTAAALAGAALVAAIVRELSRPSRLELLFVGGLLAFALWEALAMLWTQAPSQTPLEVERTLVYVAAALAVKAVVRQRRAGDLLGGALGGTALICGYALATRLFPDDFAQHTFGGGRRLYTPVGYWNGLGLVAAMGTLLAIALAARAPSALGRTLAGATVPVLLATLYFTFSRGAWLALALALLVLVALDRRRLQLLAVAAPLGAAGAIAVAVAASKVGSSIHARASTTHTVALAVVVAALAAGYAAFLVRRAERKVKLRRRTRRLIGWAVAAVALVVLAGAFARFGSPVTLAQRAYDSISRNPPQTHGNLNRRLFNLSNSGRLAQWRVALHTFEGHPVGGAGPGSYEQAWFQHRPANWKVRDAHNLYVETLAETGIVGMLLLGAALVAPLLAFGRARREPLAAGALAAYVAFLAHAIVDWDWELSGITLLALLCGGALLAWARPEPRVRGGRVPAIALAAVLGLAALYGLAGNLAMSASRHAALAGNFPRAASEARRAKLLAPWSATPWQLLGHAQLGLGQRTAGVASLEKAVSMSRRDWELWLDLAGSTRGATHAHALTIAQRLNPRDRLAPKKRG